MATELRPDNFEKEMYKLVRDISKKQFKPYLEKTYKNYAKKETARHIYKDGTETTKTVPSRISKQVKTDMTKIGSSSVLLETYSTAQPDDSILGQPFASNSPTLFSEWVEDGKIFDLKSWNMDGRPDKTFHEEYMFPEIPFIERAQTEIETNPIIIQKLVDDYFK